MTQPNEQSIVETVTKTSPPVVVSGLAMGGISINEWVLILTAVYTALQVFFLLRDKVYRPWKEKKDAAAKTV